MPLKNLVSLLSRPRGARHVLPEGKRVYAVGDIHGCLDLLERLLAQIAEDEAGRPPAETLLIFLGDLVDRGPDSRGVVERLLALQRSGTPARFLRGNHEEVFVRAASGDSKATRFLVRIGGKETILSYGISDEEYRELDFAALSRALQQRVPREHVDFLSGFERWIELGDYLFVHAGIRPGVAVEEQCDSDLCWIRDDFLRHRESFGKMVVHGHSITDHAEIRSNRIGIDTGAFYSGKLTALGLEGGDRWILST